MMAEVPRQEKCREFPPPTARQTRVMARCRLAFALIAAVVALAAGSASAASWYDGLDLTLAPRGPDEPLRLAVPGHVPATRGRLLPYLSLGSPGLADEPADDVSRPSRYHSLVDPGPRLDLGAGLSLRVFDRLHLFGEYRFFQSRPLGGSVPDAPRRETDGPALRGGFAIPF